MKNVAKLGIAAVVACAAWVGCTYFADKQQSPELLFAIEAKHGSLVHLKGDQYELAIPSKEIKSVLAFTDRPNRQAFRMKPEQYARLVHTGPDNFDVDPPNLVLSWGDHKDPAHAYELVSHHKSKGYLVYSLKKLHEQKITNRGGPAHQKGAVAIFVDGDSSQTLAECLKEHDWGLSQAGECFAATQDVIADIAASAGTQ